MRERSGGRVCCCVLSVELGVWSGCGCGLGRGRGLRLGKGWMNGKGELWAFAGERGGGGEGHGEMCAGSTVPRGAWKGLPHMYRPTVVVPREGLGEGLCKVFAVS